MPKITYGLPVYGSSDADLTIIQCFLDRCHKKRYISYPMCIYKLLEKCDIRIFKKMCKQELHLVSWYKYRTVTCVNMDWNLDCTLDLTLKWNSNPE